MHSNHSSKKNRKPRDRKPNSNGKNISSKLERYLTRRDFYRALIEKETRKPNPELNFFTPNALMIQAFHAKDGGITLRHSRFVDSIASIIYNHLTKAEKEKIHAENVSLAARLHDIGKLMVRSELLSNTGELNQKEKEEIRKHPQHARKILEMEGLPEEIIEVAEKHHSPLAEQSQLTRLIAISDAIATMHGERYYEKKTITEIIEELRKQSGKMFDPIYVKTAIKALNNRKILQKWEEIFRKRE
ncbi:MAG: HD domain-containing protein [Candidatus Diapherotrites archaeon]